MTPTPTPSPTPGSGWKCPNCGAVVSFGVSHVCGYVTVPPQHSSPHAACDARIAELERERDAEVRLNSRALVTIADAKEDNTHLREALVKAERELESLYRDECPACAASLIHADEQVARLTQQRDRYAAALRGILAVRLGSEWKNLTQMRVTAQDALAALEENDDL